MCTEVERKMSKTWRKSGQMWGNLIGLMGKFVQKPEQQWKDSDTQNRIEL